MRLQDAQQMAVLGNHPQWHDVLREHPAVGGLRKLDWAAHEATDFPHSRVPGVCEGHACRCKITVRLLAQHAKDSQRDELGKLSARLVACAHDTDGEDCLVFMPRCLEPDSLTHRSGISRQVFDRFRDRRRRGGKVEKDACLSQIHFCREVKPEERVARLYRGEFEKAVLGRDGYAALPPQQLTSRKPGRSQ
jgi:hypothetical protein